MRLLVSTEDCSFAEAKPTQTGATRLQPEAGGCLRAGCPSPYPVVVSWVVAPCNTRPACRHCTGYKLVDVPELGYSTQDKPYPRGELRLKTKLMIPGYFKHPKVS